MLLQYSPLFFSFSFSIAFLVLLVVFLRTHELPPRFLRWGLFVSVALLLCRGVAYSVLQYRFWQKALPYFLPPYQPTYFFRYAFFHFFFGLFLSGFVGALLLFIFWGLAKYSHGKWLDASERYLVVFGALAAGWPGAILYAVGVFILPLLATPWLLQTAEVRSPEDSGRPLPPGRRRVRLAPFIIISALLAMGFTPFVLPYAPWLEVLVCKTCL